ncbi:hypothetical protein PLICRDRAFT_111632 [Plicaturopsis crispa FD-325 SS-3]|nr:hypothetical protein PLICRDRAFT_111632 [Plicaturopsis crispa FD-325 SS-3]
MAPRLRVLAGPSPDALTDITSTVNTARPHRVESPLFDGAIVVHIKGLTGPDDDNLEYFGREERKGITWSLQVQGMFLRPTSADDVLFGNTFDRPLKLPWGSGAALKFMSYVDPTLEHDLTSATKPWALSPLVSTMPHLQHHDFNTTPPPTSELPPFPPPQSISDDTSQLHLALRSDGSAGDSDSDTSSVTSSVSSSASSRSRSRSSSRSRSRSSSTSSTLPPLPTASARRAHFASPEARRAVLFGAQDVLTTDFCYGFLEFAPALALRIPGGLSFDLMRYWDGQPVRFVCCERKRDGGAEPWGEVFWCVCIEMGEDSGSDAGQ